MSLNSELSIFQSVQESYEYDKYACLSTELSLLQDGEPLVW